MIAVRSMLVAVLALAVACDRSRESGKQESSLAPVAVADAVPPALDAGSDPTVGAALDAGSDPTVGAALDAGSDPTVGAALDAGSDPTVGAALDAAGAEVVVTSLPPRPGASSTVSFEAKLDFDLNFGGLQTLTSTTQSKKKKVEIIAVDPDGTVHKRITYLKRDTNAVVDGERKKDPSPIRGKTFRVTWNNVVADVRLPNGKPASTEEAEAVRREEGQLQSPELLGRALSGLRLVEGQPFDVPIAALEKLVTGDYRARRMVLTYRGKTREGTRIDAEGVLGNDGGGLKMFLELKAELLLDSTGWCRRAKVTGQVRAELNGVVVGSGAGTGTILATPLR